MFSYLDIFLVIGLLNLFDLLDKFGCDCDRSRVPSLTIQRVEVGLHGTPSPVDDLVVFAVIISAPST